MLANIITITRLLLIIPFGILLYNKGIQNLVPACLFTFIIIFTISTTTLINRIILKPISILYFFILPAPFNSHKKLYMF